MNRNTILRTVLFVVILIIIVCLAIVIGIKVMDRPINGADLITTSVNTDVSTSNFTYSEKANIDFNDILKYTGINFPNGSEIKKTFIAKPNDSQEYKYKLLDGGLYIQVSIPKDQLDLLYENIDKIHEVGAKQKFEPFFKSSPFEKNFHDDYICKYYLLFYQPQETNTDEFFRILSVIYVVDFIDYYNVYLGINETYIR